MKRGDLLKLSGKQDAIFVAAIQVAEMVPTEKGMRKVVCGTCCRAASAR